MPVERPECHGRSPCRIPAAAMALAAVLAGCSADRASMLVDGLADPPAVETWRAATGDAVDLYATETAPAPREAVEAAFREVAETPDDTRATVTA